MAAVRTMMSAVREEAAIITHEVAAVAKTEAVQSVKAEAEVLKPLAVRRAVQATVQESTPKQTSLLSEHLSITRSIDVEAPLSSTLAPTVNITTTQTESIIARHAEQDLGMSVRDAMVNASQTGVEDTMDQVAETAKKLAKSGGAAAAN